jgi:hypothetical protein
MCPQPVPRIFFPCRCNPEQKRCEEVYKEEGAPCDDAYVCTINDSCRPLPDGRVGQTYCTGDFAGEGTPCNDRDDLCTVNDRFVPTRSPTGDEYARGNFLISVVSHIAEGTLPCQTVTSLASPCLLSRLRCKLCSMHADARKSFHTSELQALWRRWALLSAAETFRQETMLRRGPMPHRGHLRPP